MKVREDRRLLLSKRGWKSNPSEYLLIILCFFKKTELKVSLNRIFSTWETECITSTYYLFYNAHKTSHRCLLPHHYNVFLSTPSERRNKLIFLQHGFAHISIVFNLWNFCTLGVWDLQTLHLSLECSKTHLENWHALHEGKHKLHATPLRMKSSCYRQMFVCTWAVSHLRTSPSEVWGLANHFQHKASF